MKLKLLQHESVRHSFFWVCGLFGLLACYGLSLGPAAMIHSATDHQGARQAIETIYAPLVWVIQNSDTAESAAYYYVNLWRDAPD